MHTPESSATGDLGREEYTIWWICSLPVELYLMEAGLEEISTKDVEGHSCILGKIRGYGVVVSCLSDNEYIPEIEAGLKSRILSYFQSIRLVLFVGLGCAINAKGRNIRIGDVAIGVPVRKNHMSGLPDALLSPDPRLTNAAAQVQLPQSLGTKGPSNRSRLERPGETNQGPVVHYGLLVVGESALYDVGTGAGLADISGMLWSGVGSTYLLENPPSLCICGVFDGQSGRSVRSAAVVATLCAKELLATTSAEAMQNTPPVIVLDNKPHHAGMTTIEEKTWMKSETETRRGKKIKGRGLTPALNAESGFSKRQLGDEEAKARDDKATKLAMLSPSASNEPTRNLAAPSGDPKVSREGLIRNRFAGLIRNLAPSFKSPRASRKGLMQNKRNTQLDYPSELSAVKGTDSGYMRGPKSSALQQSDSQPGRRTHLEKDDTGTEYSAASSKGPDYLSEFTDTLFASVRADLRGVQSLERACNILPDLLQAFALRIGYGPATQSHRDVMYYIHKRRQ